MKPQFCFHFILKHEFWDCIGYDSMKISTLFSVGFVTINVQQPLMDGIVH